MVAVDNVRSVERAIQVMRVLQQLESASLATLQAQTGLPKATLSRILQTLESVNTVWRAHGDGLWRPAFEFKPTRILKASDQKLIEVAIPVMECLRKNVVWPSDLAVRDGMTMRLLDTTRKSSGLAVNRDSIGHSIDLLQSAVGRAYLANCPDKELDTIARMLHRGQSLSVSRFMDAVVELQLEFNQKGFSERAQGYGGHDEPIQVFDDQLAAIAVPIQKGLQLIGCINIVWLRRFDKPSTLAAKHLAQLKDAASQISEAFQR